MITSEFWIEQAKAKFLAEEIMQAKAQLYQRANDNGNKGLTGKYVGHKKGNNPVEQNPKEMKAALKKLGDANKLPLILGSTQMMIIIPVYSVDDSNLGVCDVMERVKTLESTLGVFMTSQNQKFDKLTDMMGAVGQGSSPPGSAPSVAISAASSGPPIAIPAAVKDIMSN
jgi:hypothetical protein